METAAQPQAPPELAMRLARRKMRIPAADFRVEADGDGDRFQQGRLFRSVLADEIRHLGMQFEPLQSRDGRNRQGIVVLREAGTIDIDEFQKWRGHRTDSVFKRASVGILSKRTIPFLTFLEIIHTREGGRRQATMPQDDRAASHESHFAVDGSRRFVDTLSVILQTGTA